MFGFQPEIFRVTQLMIDGNILFSNLDRTSDFTIFFNSTMKTQLAMMDLTWKNV